MDIDSWQIAEGPTPSNFFDGVGPLYPPGWTPKCDSSNFTVINHCSDTMHVAYLWNERSRLHFDDRSPDDLLLQLLETLEVLQPSHLQLKIFCRNYFIII